MSQRVKTLATKRNSNSRRVRLSITVDDSLPRIFECEVAASNDVLAHAVDAGVAWFGQALGESLRRSQEADAPSTDRQRVA
jgi:hypothetical protein